MRSARTPSGVHKISLLSLPVCKVDECLHAGGFHSSDCDLLLLALRHVVSEHCVEVGDGCRQHNPVGVVQVFTNLEGSRKNGG